MDKVKKFAKIALVISIILMLLCGIVVSAVQTSGGKVTMKELNIETDAGYSMSAYLLIPDTATVDNPAPGIVTSHGYLNNKEMQDANYVELARRGYVVLAIDQPCHGDSESQVVRDANGVYQGALALSRMPFVDIDRIGVTGHSMGGASCGSAVLQDNQSGNPIISAVLHNCANGTYVDDSGAYANVYGTRDVGIISAQYDEFMHQFTDSSGTLRQAPYFMENPDAQSFLNFGADPAGAETRNADTIYHQEIDGVDAIRVIYRPDIIHPWSHFSAKSTTRVIEFFEEAFGAPNPIASSDQVWQWKEAFNCVGLIGFGLFICSFAILMVFTPLFSSLRAAEPAKPAKIADKTGLVWFWGSLAAGALFGTLIYLPSVTFGNSLAVKQTEAMGLGLWSTLCGLFCILSMVVFYFCYGKKHGMDLADLGVKMPIKKLGLSVLLGVIVAAVAYGCVFVADYFFFADFRIWTLAIKAFEAPILRYWPYMLLFVTYYVAHSVATNCFNYNTVGGKSWVNTIIAGLFAAFPAIIMPWIQYITYYTTKHMMWSQTPPMAGPNYPMFVLWLFPILLILFFSTVINRVIYKATKNPYIAGVANAIVVGLLTITNTCSTL